MEGGTAPGWLPTVTAVALLLTAATGASAGPLLTYAASQTFPPLYTPAEVTTYQKRVAQLTTTLARDPPPKENCSQTLGAKRFSTIYDDLGQAYTGLNKSFAAIAVFKKAIDCNPRAEFLHAELAASYMDLARYTEARKETEHQISLGRANFTFYTLLVQLDFLDQRWSDTIADAKIAAVQAPSDDQAMYWQCFLWLAQLHTGTQHPQLAKRHASDAWPAPILESLQGMLTEGQLLEVIQNEQDGSRRRDMLTEALFYTGEQRLATKQTDEAMKYFTATVNLKVLYFIEHHLAEAQLRKLR